MRSKGSDPLWTLTSVVSVLRMARLQPMTVRRKRLRVTSIFLGQGDLFLPRQQRNLRHLREIHADRIAAPLGYVRRGRQGLAALPGISPS